MAVSSSDSSPCRLPSNSTFSFTAPFPTTTSSSNKQRRVSLAQAASPRLVPAWSFRDDTSLDARVGDPSSSGLVPEKKGKMRRIATDEDDECEAELPPLPQEKKQRKKWSMEETKMLVDGCNTWGVGNWKAILNDPKLKFDNRSPVDLKDRFRTYFPDAYKQHYPNAKTHLSSKVRSALPDGSSIFEKTRSKKRRPFTAEEDKALKAGYDKHGTVWAAIVKDPVFQEQNRRSTDLRDRFRNAFPDLYQAAGYKPRTTAKRKKSDAMPIRAATDDQLSSSTRTAGPVRRTRSHTNPGLFRGGTKSVPESTTCSEDEIDSSGEEDNDPLVSTPLPIDEATPQPEEPFTPSDALAEVDMHTIDPLSDPLSLADFLPSSTSQSLTEITDSSQSQTWSSGCDTPVHSSCHWSSATTGGGSPTSSHRSGSLADYFISSPFQRRGDSMQLIGKSAWGTQDWLSGNPRLDPSAASSSSSSFIGGPSPAPSSPFSFSHLNHGVLDRYDLFPTTYPHDFASEAGVGDTHSTFSDPEMFAPSSFRGFTHHSSYAGDLIFGARTHQPQQPYYGLGFGFGAGSEGLGLSGMQQSAGIHPMQLHTPALPGIDEIELTSINLNDQVSVDDAMEEAIHLDAGMQKDDPDGPLSMTEVSPFALSPRALEDIVAALPLAEVQTTPPGTPSTSQSFRPPRSSQQRYPPVHLRSVSVPPLEHRSGQPSRPAQLHTNSTPPPASFRSMFLSETPQHANDPPQTLSPTQSITVADGKASDQYDLPFLDLHYYSSSGSFVSTGAHLFAPEVGRQGQALDLAQYYPKSLISATGMLLPLPPVPPSAIPPVVPPPRPHSHHHRVQSAVSPNDLLLRKGSDNKRKRASWDGGPS